MFAGSFSRAFFSLVKIAFHFWYSVLVFFLDIVGFPPFLYDVIPCCRWDFFWNSVVIFAITFAVCMWASIAAGYFLRFKACFMFAFGRTVKETSVHFLPPANQIKQCFHLLIHL